jgi:hypothetical protein
MFTANVPQKYVAGNGWKFEPPGRKERKKGESKQGTRREIPPRFQVANFPCG